MKGSCSQNHLRGIFTGIVTQIFQQYFFDRRKRFVAMDRQRETLVPRLFSLKLLMSRSKHDRRLLVQLTKFSTFYHRARKLIVRSGEHFYRRWKSISRFFMYFLEMEYCISMDWEYSILQNDIFQNFISISYIHLFREIVSPIFPQNSTSFYDIEIFNSYYNKIFIEIYSCYNINKIIKSNIELIVPIF